MNKNSVIFACVLILMYVMVFFIFTRKPVRRLGDESSVLKKQIPIASTNFSWNFAKICIFFKILLKIFLKFAKFFQSFLIFPQLFGNFSRQRLVFFKIAWNFFHNFVTFYQFFSEVIKNSFRNLLKSNSLFSKYTQFLRNYSQTFFLISVQFS